MKRSLRARGIALVATAALTVSVALVAPASAARHAATVVRNAFGLAKLTNPPSTISNCTPTALKAGATSRSRQPPPGSKAGTLSGTFTWRNGKGTTVILRVVHAPEDKGQVPAGTTRVTVTGKVTGGTGAAAKIIKMDEPVSASICAYMSGPKTGKITLEPGTKYKM